MRDTAKSIERTQRKTGSFAWILCLFAPIAAISISRYDAHIVHWVMQRNLPGDIEKALQLSEAFAHGSGVIAIFAGVLLIDYKRRRQVLSMICMVVVAMVVANLAKSFFSRARPYNFSELAEMTKNWFPKPTREGWDTGNRSFPSGHSATGVAMAFALSNLYPRGKYLFVVLAVLACFQRIASRSHYPTDVLAGVTIAATVALVWQKFFPSQTVDLIPIAATASTEKMSRSDPL